MFLIRLRAIYLRTKTQALINQILLKQLINGYNKMALCKNKLSIYNIFKNYNFLFYNF